MGIVIILYSLSLSVCLAYLLVHTVIPLLLLYRSITAVHLDAKRPSAGGFIGRIRRFFLGTAPVVSPSLSLPSLWLGDHWNYCKRGSKYKSILTWVILLFNPQQQQKATRRRASWSVWLDRINLHLVSVRQSETDGHRDIAQPPSPTDTHTLTLWSNIEWLRLIFRFIFFICSVSILRD